MTQQGEPRVGPAGLEVEPDVPPLLGLVMAGGRSRRMGRDKALLDFHGMSQVRWTARLLRTLCPEVHISCRPGQDLGGAEEEGFTRIHDELEGQGPMAGFLAAQAVRPDAAWLAVACDLPRLDETTLRYLVDARDADALATAYRAAEGGLPEPLCAIYEPAARAAFQRALATGRRCPRKLLIENAARVRLVDLPQPRALDNVNTPDEAARTLGGRP